MSHEIRTKRVTPVEVLARKGKEPLVMITAYHAPFARLADPHVDILLVGDSLAMVLYGEASTLPLTLDTLIGHARAVVKASAKAMVVVDMPFGSYEESKEQAFKNCARVLKETGAAAVKLETHAVLADTVQFLVQRGIPVMGHVGLTPQAVNVMGGFKVQGREGDAERVMRDAKTIADAGAFALVVEGVPAVLAEAITRAIAIPTIGIGASALCDGQVLVMEDMLGLSARVPRFVRRYAELGSVVSDAVARYSDDVKNRQFPATQETYE